ncbi:MAG: hypothetical protein MN733_27585, partial [Nitrososphaera sp.]|nr:hypothetical protein [Nitrososphaera sp.]
MSGSLRQAWSYLATDLWEQLAAYSTKQVAAPFELYSDLLAAADKFLSEHPTDVELEEARNNLDKARQLFLALKGTDFTGESAIVRFLEEAHNIIVGY